MTDAPLLSARRAAAARGRVHTLRGVFQVRWRQKVALARREPSAGAPPSPCSQGAQVVGAAGVLPGGVASATDRAAARQPVVHGWVRERRCVACLPSRLTRPPHARRRRRLGWRRWGAHRGHPHLSAAAAATRGAAAAAARRCAREQRGSACTPRPARTRARRTGTATSSSSRRSPGESDWAAAPKAAAAATCRQQSACVVCRAASDASEAAREGKLLHPLPQRAAQRRRDHVLHAAW